jgi:hypothetical protein
VVGYYKDTEWDGGYSRKWSFYERCQCELLPWCDYPIYSHFVCDENEKVVYLKIDTHLQLSRGNNATDRLPDELWFLKDLAILIVKDLELLQTTHATSFPSEVGQLQSLVYLDMSNNAFTGTITSEIGQLSKLRYLNLGSNELTGSVPTELGLLTSLSTLDLRSNALKGLFPKELSKLTNLTQLFLHDNSLSGPIPQSVASLTRLETLNLEGNATRGTALLLKSWSPYFKMCGDDCGMGLCACPIDEPGDFMLIMLLISMVIATVVLTAAAVTRLRNEASGQQSRWKKLNDEFNPSEHCDTGSVYWFALPGGSWIGCLVFGITVALQLSTFYFILYHIQKDDTPEDDKPEDDEKNAPYIAYIPAAVVVFIYLQKDIMMSLRIIIRGGSTGGFRCFCTGFTMLFITTVALGITFQYFTAYSPSPAESLTSSVNIIVVNEIDEKLYDMLVCACPRWVKRQRTQYLQRVEKDQQITEASSNEHMA